MIRGAVWLAQVGRKSRPVLVLTRTEVLDVRMLVTVAEISTSIRRLAVEVPFDHGDAGIHTTSRVHPVRPEGSVSDPRGRSESLC